MKTSNIKEVLFIITQFDFNKSQILKYEGPWLSIPLLLASYYGETTFIAKKDEKIVWNISLSQIWGRIIYIYIRVKNVVATVAQLDESLRFCWCLWVQSPLSAMNKIVVSEGTGEGKERVFPKNLWNTFFLFILLFYFAKFLFSKIILLLMSHLSVLLSIYSTSVCFASWLLHWFVLV